jgi:hypothetical protein
MAETPGKTGKETEGHRTAAQSAGLAGVTTQQLKDTAKNVKNAGQDARAAAPAGNLATLVDTGAKTAKVGAKAAKIGNLTLLSKVGHGAAHGAASEGGTAVSRGYHALNHTMHHLDGRMAEKIGSGIGKVTPQAAKNAARPVVDAAARGLDKASTAVAIAAESEGWLGKGLQKVALVGGKVPLLGAICVGSYGLYKVGKHVSKGEFGKAGLELGVGIVETAAATGGFLTFGAGELTREAVRGVAGKIGDQYGANIWIDHSLTYKLGKGAVAMATGKDAHGVIDVKGAPEKAAAASVAVSTEKSDRYASFSDRAQDRKLPHVSTGAATVEKAVLGSAAAQVEKQSEERRASGRRDFSALAGEKKAGPTAKAVMNTIQAKAETEFSTGAPLAVNDAKPAAAPNTKKSAQARPAKPMTPGA